MLILEWIIVVTAGLILGSFATAIVYREPREEPWWDISRSSKRSKCPACGAALSATELIPLFSWLFSKGKCRHCSQSIGYIYPLIELACLCTAIAVYLALGFTMQSFFLLCALPFLIALFVIDLQYMILPNRLVFITAVIGLFSLLTEIFVLHNVSIEYGLINYALGAVVYGAVAWGLRAGGQALLKKEALGMGDVKFFAVAGLWLGCLSFADFCFVAGFLGVVLGLIWKGSKKQGVFPFGPALILSLCGLLLLDGSLFY